MKNIIVVIFSLFVGSLQAQYTDYLGAGHDQGITVTTSHNHNDATGEKTINADGMDARLMETSRFLAQATFGANMDLIKHVDTTGFSTWIDSQLVKPVTLLTPMMDSIWDEIFDLRVQNGQDPDDIFGPYAVHVNYAWWQLNMTNIDLLRQRVALALSEILVVSAESDLGGRANALTSFYDVLIDNALGNFEDLMMDVTLHASMGYYLSHLNNPKAIPEENIHPDENYAREIMQLFSIGLYELNLDGSEKLDGNGDPIPTYNNDDIKELAKVFTGLGPGEIADWVEWVDEPYFGLGFYGTDAEVPMIMYEDWHESGPKDLIGGFTIPGGQPGMQDIEMTVNHLFNHPNVGPFISRRLIQRLVTSNPSPAFISRVATVFNDNGQGVRGDLSEVVKTILLDVEARDCAAMMDTTYSRMREPIVKYIHFARALPLDSPLGRYWNNGYDFLDATKQHPLWSPTVFNFFTPDHQPVGEIADADLVAPEFKLHNTSTAVGYINRVNNWAVWDNVMYSWEGDIGDPVVELNTTDYEPMAEEPDILLNELDILLTHGQLTDDTRLILRNSMVPFEWGDYNYNRTRMAIYLMMISPDYNILK